MCELEKDKETVCCGSNEGHEGGAMCFRRAIRELMNGVPVTRKAWNKSGGGSSGKYLAIMDGTRFDKEAGEIRIVDIREFSFNDYVLTKEDVETHDWVYATVCAQGG